MSHSLFSIFGSSTSSKTPSTNNTGQTPTQPPAEKNLGTRLSIKRVSHYFKIKSPPMSRENSNPELAVLLSAQSPRQLSALTEQSEQDISNRETLPLSFPPLPTEPPPPLPTEPPPPLPTEQDDPPPPNKLPPPLPIEVPIKQAHPDSIKEKLPPLPTELPPPLPIEIISPPNPNITVSMTPPNPTIVVSMTPPVQVLSIEQQEQSPMVHNPEILSKTPNEPEILSKTPTMGDVIKVAVENNNNSSETDSEDGTYNHNADSVDNISDTESEYTEEAERSAVNDDEILGKKEEPKTKEKKEEYHKVATVKEDPESKTKKKHKRGFHIPTLITFSPTFKPSTPRVLSSPRPKTYSEISRSSEPLDVEPSYPKNKFDNKVIGIEWNGLMQRVTTEDEFDVEFHHEKVTVDWTKFPERRNKIAYELLISEATYVRSLQICIMVFITPIEQWLAGLHGEPDNDLQGMSGLFKMLIEMVNVNYIILNNLRKRFTEWSTTQQIADILITMTPYLKIYKLYGENYETALVGIDRYKNKIQNSQFLSILSEGERHPLSRRNNLECMLILPVQRIPRYVLLLTDLKNNTDQNHPDFSNITKSLEDFKSLADAIDESIGKAKSRAQCIEIQSRIESLYGRKAFSIPTLVEAHRVFIKEGVLKKQGPSKITDQRFYLFNDLLLITPMSAEKLKSLKPFYLKNITIKDTSPADPSFILLSYGESFVVYAKNIDEKNEWLKLLESYISVYNKNVTTSIGQLQGEIAPIWILDEAATQCMRCDADFGYIVRKHHCRNCGAVVCSSCSAYTAIVAGVDKHKEVKVCNVCKKVISQIRK